MSYLTATARKATALWLTGQGMLQENVLLDKEGHIKVTDFGLAKANMSAEGRTNSFIGTMEYMAPEIILGMGHGKAVDWWSVGILLYEMLCGMPPFKAKGRQQLQKQITTAKLKLPRATLPRPPAAPASALVYVWIWQGCEELHAHAWTHTMGYGRGCRRALFLTSVCCLLWLCAC